MAESNDERSRAFLYDPPLFFPVSLFKFIVMSFALGGFYQIYWFYKNWTYIQPRINKDINPSLRGLFAVIFCYPCFKEIKKTAKSHNVEISIAPGLLAVVYVALLVSWRLPGPYWLISLLSWLPLVPLQIAINRLNALVAPNHKPNSEFSRWNIAGACVGGSVFILGIIGTFLPDK